MFLALAVVAVVSAFAGGVAVNRYGAKAKADWAAAHSVLYAKLYAVRREVEQLELEGKADEAKVVARIKALL